MFALKGSKKDIFETMPVRRAVLAQILPAIASQLVALLYSLADTYFVGRLNDPDQTAAVTVAGAVFLLLTALSNLFGIGGASLVSRKLGMKKGSEAAQVSAFCFWYGAIAAVVFGLAVGIFSEPILKLAGAKQASLEYAKGYLFYSVALGALPTVATTLLANLVRAEGASLAASIGVMLGCFINIALDPVFVLPFGLNMGAAGAGAATAISNAAGMLYFIVCIGVSRRARRSVLSLEPKLLRFAGSHSKEVLKIGLPSALQYALTVVAVSVQLSFVSKYGSSAVAALGITKKLDQLPLFFSIGVANGLLPLIGYNYSAGNFERTEKAFRFGSAISLGFALACVIVYELLAPSLAALFIKDGQTVEYAASFLRRMVIAMPFMSICYPMITKFQAMGKAKESLTVSLMRKGVLDIPLYFALDAARPLYGCMWVQPIVDSVSLAAAIALNSRIVNADKRKAAQGGEAENQE
ncbi:MAG: MATE family efflux transporter [Clostridia bacterium]|nr:MATE family efflux transporter [Clostridia bacterium]